MENKKIENLFSQDPMGAFEKIEQDFVRYFRAAYKIDDKDIDDKRIEKLTQDNNMSKEAYIEILPEYSTVQSLSAIDDLTKQFNVAFGCETISKNFFDFVSKGLMDGLMTKYKPYGHQIGMMKKAFAGLGDDGSELKYKNTVITSGTGSGKTESFLLPLLADIFKESQSWVSTTEDHSGWYNCDVGGQYRPKQREGDLRPSALRAIVLYPMNALVEDQIARLREALDSDNVRTFLDEKLNGNRIYFGSYNGSTIAPKSCELLRSRPELFNRKKEEVAKQLREISENFASIKEYVNTHPDKKDALYISPRLDGKTSEMITRWDMQSWAPDIMITNTSMLSIMLMRKAEENIFEKTKRWLAAEDLPEEQREEAKKNRIFHVVVDELHLYRGTAGSEVACLLRMLYNAIGLSPVENGKPNPQLKILASSASLGDENATQKFMEEFFGVYSDDYEPVFNIQSGTDYIDTLKGQNNIEDININYTEFSYFTHENFVALDKDIDSDNETQVGEIFKRRKSLVDGFVQDKFGCNGIEDFVDKYQNRIFFDFYSVMPENADGDAEKGKKPSIRPISQTELCKKLFGDDKDALRGFLIFRGFIDQISTIKHKLPRLRFHKFFKYVEGLWGELKPSLDGQSTPIEDLSYVAKEVGSNNRKVLELLRCENCGKLFIGGNRKISNGGNLYLTLNYPNLDQIPNFNPTPMAQNKNYRDYAIFWPTDADANEVSLLGGDARSGAEDHVVSVLEGDTQYRYGRASWKLGYLDSVTGEFISNDRAIDSSTGNLKTSIQDHGIRGFLYKVNYDTKNKINDDEASKIYAMPCTCPHCRQNYTLRKYTNSPIRSFRAGIDRSNQILSKELLCQLDEKSAKLIGFSDSREDAAKQALGIEKEHYRDMVRMLFVECVSSNDDEELSKIKDFIIQSWNEGKELEEIENEAEQKWPTRCDIKAIVSRVVSAITRSREPNLDSFKSDRIPLKDFVSSECNGILVKKLLEKGINPAGEAYKFQWYTSSQEQRNIHWSEVFDFTTCTPNFNVANRVDNPRNLEEIRNNLINAIFANSFGKYMGVSVLDAGIGYVCGPQSDAINNSQEYRALRELLPNEIDVFEFIDAFIRVMGDNYLYPSKENNGGGCDSYENLKAIVKWPIRRLVDSQYRITNTQFNNNYRQREMDLGNAVVNYLTKNCCFNNLLLDLDKLCFKKMTEENYIKCKKCGRVHPNMGFGFCTNTYCMEELDRTETISKEELNKHYISFDILKEKKTPKKLHTEELSGQTDDIQSRLRQFKDLILCKDDDDSKVGKEKTLPIDMLCVTTTMEVGVDIGSLQAIFQGNMPPTRYNYQQRVGRGGRRGQAFSTAVTFCRGRSHDVYYYETATGEMVGGIPATPTLSLAPYQEKNGEKKMKVAIMKRVIIKEVLRQAYNKLDYNLDLNDTAGEFGTIDQWKDNDRSDNTKFILNTWINGHHDDIDKIVHRYFDQFNREDEIKKDISEMITYIKGDLVNQIDGVVSRSSDPVMGLAKYLSESGFLPMYGMPSDSRNFYHSFDSVKNKVKSIDRSSEMAITEFAPGSEKTKDKGKYRVEGLTIPMQETGNLCFYDPKGDALVDRSILVFDNDNRNIIDIREAPRDKSIDDINMSEHEKLIVIPQAYRSLKIRENLGEPIDNNDRGSSFTQSSIFAKESDSGFTKTVKNVDISVYGLNLNEDSTIWHINTNNGRFYTGNYYTENDPAGRNPNFMFYAENNNTIAPMNNGVSIALGSKKVTDMIKLTLKSSPKTLNLSLKDPNSNKSAIRAAFYSAAFLLQRALADKLDVQPEEIEICERVDENCDYPLIYLSDALPNGAGIVSYLYEDGKLEELIKSIVNFDSFDVAKTSKDKSFMQSLIAHRDNCLTACQKCLMTYTNRGFHHILDWRLGVGILRLMLDESYDFGFTAEARDQYEELKDWDAIVKASAAKLNISQDDSCSENGFYYKDDTIIYHPLWKREKVCDQIPNCTKVVKMYNTFKLLRSDLTSDTGSGKQNRLKKENAQVSPTQDTSDSRVENVDTQENTNNLENPDASIDIVVLG